ncbi:triose-phosphate transporter family-domain-containing protein [Phlebopus sp. FC_14]|nr:triose-phosphate transporter family-domain-containing protein [Phlebopus sp. FC_14]
MAHHGRSSHSSVHLPILPNPEEYLDDDDDETAVHVASVTEKKRFWWRNAAINTCFILSWFLFATVLSLYNKWMFSPDHFGFPYPLFVTTLHFVVQFLLAAILRFAFPRRFCPERRPTLRSYGVKAAPAAMATGLDIGLSNVSLKTITLSFYTMCKSSSLIFVLCFAFFFKIEQFSLRLVAVILIIFGGVVLMVASETSFVLAGFLLVMSASVCGGLRWSLTQLLMKDKNMGLDTPPATIYWLSPMMGVTLAVISLIWEGWGRVFGTSFFDSAASTIHTTAMLVSPGILAFCMVMSEYYIIQRAGVLPMSIAGIAKEVSTITVSAWFFGDELTPVNITGVAITICGIALFTYHKYRKTLDSDVALDSHGNAIQLDDSGDPGVASPGSAFDLEDVASSHPARPNKYSPANGDGDVHRHLLFSTEGLDEGEEDAEELRSVRSSKIDHTVDETRGTDSDP